MSGGTGFNTFSSSQKATPRNGPTQNTEDGPKRFLIMDGKKTAIYVGIHGNYMEVVWDYNATTGGYLGYLDI